MLPKKTGFADEQGVMRALLAQLMTHAPSSLAQKTPQATIVTVAKTYFLLDPQTGVKQFVTNTLEPLVQQLSRSTQQHQVVYQGQVRGRIAWPATFKARYGQDYNPTRFVCREVRHQYNTLENQLLRYIVERIQECLQLVPPALREGVCCYKPSQGDLTPQPTALALGALATVLGRLRRNLRLWEVTLPQQITARHLLRAKTSPVEAYTEVAQIYEQYCLLVATASWHKLAQVSQRLLLLPATTGIAEEKWITLAADMLRGQSHPSLQPSQATPFKQPPIPIIPQLPPTILKLVKPVTITNQALHFNGVNGATGALLTPALTIADCITWLLNEAQNEPTIQKNIMRTTWEMQREEVMGVIAGVDAQNITDAGWGIIYPEDTPAAVKEALAPLVAHRQGRELLYKPGTSYWHFRKVYKQGPGVVNPQALPYYLLIVGSPDQIPFRFQYGLDTEHAVGRIYFEEVADYARYAQQVIAYETHNGRLPRQRRVAFFSPVNPNDKNTALSDQYLVEPLVSQLKDKTLKTINGQIITDVHGQPLIYQTEHIRGEAATKQALVNLLTRQAHAPTILFTATHGLGFPHGHARQKTDQGALVCAEWPGGGSRGTTLTDEMYLSGRHLPPEARFDNLIIYAFACYSAGTPYLQDFEHFNRYQPSELAPTPFMAYLPQRLLAQGALAFIGHVDRAWGYSFLWGNLKGHTDTYRSTLEAILTGVSLGHAFEYVNRRYQDLNNYLTGSHENSLINQYYGGEGNPSEIANAWIARNDARGLCAVW